MRAVVLGTGMHVPELIVRNDDLARIMDTTDEWIRVRTGIEERHYAEPGVASSDLGVEAARAALADAGTSPEEIDYVVFATMTPDYYFPGSGADPPAQARARHDPVPGHPAAVRRLHLRAADRRRGDPLRPVPQGAARRRRGPQLACNRGPSRAGTSCSGTTGPGDDRGVRERNTAIPRPHGAVRRRRGGGRDLAPTTPTSGASSTCCCTPTARTSSGCGPRPEAAPSGPTSTPPWSRAATSSRWSKGREVYRLAVT